MKLQSGPTRSAALALLLLPALLFASAASPVGGDEVQLAEAEVFIEWNSTDDDFGVHIFFDGGPWRRMRIVNADEIPVMQIKCSQSFAEQGMTEAFFESAEPPTSVLSMEEFLDRFPEGEYEFEGKTLDGRELEGETDFTHDIPEPPSRFVPNDGARVDAGLPLVLRFAPVEFSIFGDPLEIEFYEVVLEAETELGQTMKIVLDGGEKRPAVTVPPEFLLPGTEYKLEVLAQEESGNRTASEVAFETL